jgi:hypothetical protein
MKLLFSSLKIINQAVLLNELTSNILLLETKSKMVPHIYTRAMLADYLTKALPPTLYKEHVAGIGLVNEF